MLISLRSLIVCLKQIVKGMTLRNKQKKFWRDAMGYNK
jgi:hypothetical protein